MNLFGKQKQTHRLRNKLLITKEEGLGIHWKYGINIYTYACVHVQPLPALCNPMNFSPSSSLPMKFSEQEY